MSLGAAARHRSSLDTEGGGGFRREVDGGVYGAADAEGSVLEEGRDGSAAVVDRGGPVIQEVPDNFVYDRSPEGSAFMVVHLVHVRASLRDEPLDDLEGEQEEGREEGRSAEEGRGNVHGVWNDTTRH